MRAKPAVTGQSRTRLRCAVYTRKSSEEGLEQDFNSLHAQREACDAYIASQRQEGWVALPAMYDDGGFSGGTTDRPALQRLLADIAAGKIDIVVVYKVDRLTRSLTDFARIVDLFDKHRVSFVSVTQAFNTTTSMGRLTLNVLLSFAQFEREVTGERIRDKIAASKKKGMWMGGQPPLGYDVQDRKLVPNEAEAAIVRHIFRRYVELRSVRDLKAELDSAGIVSKARRAADGSPYGARPLARGALYLMLSNRIYRGEIVHKGQGYPGEHAAIVDEGLFSVVQAILAGNRVERRTGGDSSEPSLLMGLVHEQQRLLALLTLRSEIWPTLATLEARKALLAIVPRLEVHPDRVEITIDNAGLAAWLEEEVDGPVLDRPDRTASDRAVTVLTVPVRLKQRGNELRLVIEGAADEAAPNPSLTRVVARAHLVSACCTIGQPSTTSPARRA